MSKSKARLMATAVTALSLSACSLVNPHVRVAEKIRYPEEATDPVIARTLPNAARYADQQKKAYEDAIDDRAAMTSMMGAGLIALSAAALGVGATGGGTELLLGMGLAGAAAVGAGSWVNSKPDQFAFAAGQMAIICTEQALTPLTSLSADVLPNVNKFTYGFTETGEGDGTVAESPIPALAPALVEAQGKIAQMQVIYGRITEKGLTAEVEPEKKLLDDATKAVASAEQVRVKATDLIKVANRAGADWFSAIDRIVNAVDKALIGNSPELSSLPSVIGGLAGLSKGFGNTTDLLSPKPKTEKAAEVGGLVAASPSSQSAPVDPDVADFRTAARELEELSGLAVVSAGRVAAVVDQVDTTKIGALTGCGINPQDLAPPLSILPAETSKTFKNTATSNKTITIQNGRPPYSASLTESAPKGLSIVAPVLMGNTVTIMVEKDAAKGTTPLVIGDSAGQTIQVMIVIE